MSETQRQRGPGYAILVILGLIGLLTAAACAPAVVIAVWQALL